jgi:serine/threonine protein kinase
MAFCTNCGATLVDGSAFCGACGATAGISGARATDSQSSPRANTPDSSTSGSGLRAGPFDDPDRYLLEELRSRGGEGELWRSSLSIDGVRLPVAVKVINEANNDRLDDWSRRWQQQAEILRTLDHPSLVKVRDTFEGPLPHPPGAADPNSRSLYLVMNWVVGESLVDWVAHHPERDILDSARVIAKMAAAVDYLHSGASTGKPVLHRDIKPANVLIDGANVCLVDFGFARLMSGEPMTLAGTPHYLAPEVVGGGTFGEASDRYALGATAYYAIVGEPPTPGDDVRMRAKLAQARGAEGRADLADHVLAMMAREPAQRPANTIEWAQALAAGAVSTTMPTRVMPPIGAVSAPADVAPMPVRKRRGKLFVLVAVLAVVAAIAVAGAAFALKGRNDNGPPVAATTDSSVGSPISSPSPLPSPSDSYSPSTQPSPSDSYGASSAPTAEDGLTHMNLSQLAEPVNGYINTGEYTLQTKPYFYSLETEPDSYDGTQSVEYNVPPGFNKFHATIGMDDSSGSSARTTFQVTDPITGGYLFGAPGHLVTVKVNQARVVDLTLPSGILRIKLTTISHANDSDWDVGVYPVWGDAEFTGPQGQAVLPTPPAEE